MPSDMSNGLGLLRADRGIKTLTCTFSSLNIEDQNILPQESTLALFELKVTENQRFPSWNFFYPIKAKIF